ncbi:MAG TPA: hypothetical protein VI756_07135 [Blastocatellia bacterium]
MMGGIPLGINDRAAANLDDAIARTEANRCSRLDKINMRPLVAMIVDIVSNLAKQNPVILKHPIGLLDKGRVKVSKVVAMFFRRPQAKPKTDIEILLPVAALIRNMRGVTHNHVKEETSKGHGRIIANDGWPML